MISVCMATYNGEKYLREQIDSIIKQITENDELIISDDGSNDRTLEIIKEYCDHYSNIIFIEGPQKGVVKNFENALKCAKGTIIFLADQDDIWKNDKVIKVLDAFKDEKITLVLHDADIIDGNSQRIMKSFFEHRKSKKGLINNLIKNSYLGCCMAFKNTLLDYVLDFPEYIEMHDWWIGLIAEKKGKVCFLKDKLISYRRHENNVSSFKHHPFNIMIRNRVYLIIQLFNVKKRWKK